MQISKQLAHLVVQTYGRQTYITLELNIMGSCIQDFIEALTPESFLDRWNLVHSIFHSSKRL